VAAANGVLIAGSERNVSLLDVAAGRTVDEIDAEILQQDRQRDRLLDIQPPSVIRSMISARTAGNGPNGAPVTPATHSRRKRVDCRRTAIGVGAMILSAKEFMNEIAVRAVNSMRRKPAA